MLVDHLIFFACWVLFYGLHSLLAATKVKQVIPLRPTLYRFFYSLFSTLSLGFVLILGASIYSPLLIYPNPISFGVGLLSAAYGIFIVKRSFRNYSFREFMGLKKESDPKLKTSGIQSKIRHPLYTGTVLLVIGYVLYNPLLINFVSLLALIIYLPIGIRLEERKLTATFGNEYIEYKKAVPSLIPRLSKKDNNA